MRTLLLSLLLITNVCYSVQAQCSRSASFQNGVYVVTGTATIEFTLTDDKELDITNLSTPAGPDLHVYLSNTTSITTGPSDIPPAGTVDLGLLPSEFGNHNFTIPSDVSIDEYDYVLIQCKQFNVLWGFSQLGTQQGADCASLSIEDVAFNATNFYPNPTKEIITFDSAFNDEIRVNVYNAFGARVVSDKTLKSNKEQVSVAHLISGVYQVELLADKKRLVRKLIIQ